MNKANISTMTAVLAGLAVVGSVHVSQGALRAQAGRSTAEGVYTDAQAKRGEQVYAETCSACHGSDLKGTTVVPALIGPEFESFWKGQPLGDLFEKVSTTMPKSAPGSLKPEQSADAVAYLLSMLKAPAGTVELAPKLEELKQINIEAAKQ